MRIIQIRVGAFNEGCEVEAYSKYNVANNSHFTFCFYCVVESLACLVMKTLLRTVSKRNQPKSLYDYTSTFKAEHIIYLDELTCELSKVEVRVSAFHVKICQSTNISKAGLILEDIDFSQLNDK